MSNSQIIFKKVGLSEKKMLFREAAEDKVQVSVKTEEDEIFHLIAVQDDKDVQLLCHHTADSKEQNKSRSVIVNFSFRNERYFFKSQISFSAGWVILDIMGDLFQLQRRANARVEMPSEYQAVMSILQLGLKIVFIETRIRDVSAGGLKVEFPKAGLEVAIGDKIRGAVKLGIRRPIECMMEVRHTSTREVKGTEFISLGLQFMDIDTLMENRLLSLMMDLQRELFLKYSKKT